MTNTRLLAAYLMGFIFGLVGALLLVGCAPITRIPVDVDGVRHTASLQFNTPLRAFVLVPESLMMEGKRWPLLIPEDMADGVMICFEHRTNNHTEDCTVLGNLRKYTQGRR